MAHLPGEGNPAIAVIIAAAGSSTRFRNKVKKIKKEYHPFIDVIGGRTAVDVEGKPLTVLGAVASAFASVPRISRIAVVVPPRVEIGEAVARQALPQRLLRPGSHPEVLFVPGGLTRRSSVHHGLSALASSLPNSPRLPDYVLIHDGARPWVSRELINRVIDAMLIHRAAIPVLPIEENLIETGPDSPRYLPPAAVAAQTPQGFAFAAILDAHERAAHRVLSGEAKLTEEYTDDAEIWGEFVGPVATVPGDEFNRKITFPEDLNSAERRK